MNRTPPMKIIMLIEVSCFVYVNDISSLNGSPASKRFFAELLREELIEPCDNVRQSSRMKMYHGFQASPRGKALIEKWCEQPLPVLQETWV